MPAAHGLVKRPSKHFSIVQVEFLRSVPRSHRIGSVACVSYSDFFQKHYESFFSPPILRQLQLLNV